MPRSTIVALILLALTGCGSAPQKPTANAAQPVTPNSNTSVRLVDLNAPPADERDDWEIQIEEIRSRYNQQINAMIERRDPLYDEIQALETQKGTAPAESYTRMGNIIRGINDLIERRDSEVTEINKNKRAHTIGKQPVSEEFLKAQQAEKQRLKSLPNK